MQVVVPQQPGGELKVLDNGFKHPGSNTCPYATAHNWRRLLRALTKQGASGGGTHPEQREAIISDDLLAAMRVPMEDEHFEHLRALAVKDVLDTWRDNGTGLGPELYDEKFAKLIPHPRCAHPSPDRLWHTTSRFCNTRVANKKLSVQVLFGD